MGFVRTSDGLHMLAAGGVDGQFLTLIGDRMPYEPDLPDGEIDYGPGSPWAGMSGAVVIARGMVIGVIRSHHLSKGFQSLTVTPLTALRLLPTDTRQQFCAGLGIEDLGKLPMLTGDDTAVPSVAVQLTTAAFLGEGTGFSREVHERYANDPIWLDWRNSLLAQALISSGSNSAESQRFECAAASRAGVEEALRQAVDWLPEGDVYVDLCLPRNWLEAGVEHGDVVEMGGQYESLARNFQPRLRWSMHWLGYTTPMPKTSFMRSAG
jgi:hypothetical protein